MALLLILTGILHFRVPRVYVRIIPPYIPHPRMMVALSGIAEITLGILLLFSKTQFLAAWGIILMMVVFFPVHFYMLENESAGAGLPKWLLIVRIPMQIGIMWWAYMYVR